MNLVNKFRTDKSYYLYNASTNHVIEVGKLIYDLIDWYGEISDKELVYRFCLIFA